MTAHVLLLAGTMEARELAQMLCDNFPGLAVTASLAGAVQSPAKLPVRCRVGGFGGAKGLTAFLEREKVTHIVDATHPFAEQISRNAEAAARSCRTPLVRLERPAWPKRRGDRWLHVPSVEKAVAAIPSGARSFLSIGRKDIEKFCARGTEIYGLVRMIDPPCLPLPDDWDLLLAHPLAEQEAEAELLRRYRVTHVVSRNSGGKGAFAKIAAARTLRLPVIMIDRPPRQVSTSVATAAEAIIWLESGLADG